VGRSAYLGLACVPRIGVLPNPRFRRPARLGRRFSCEKFKLFNNFQGHRQRSGGDPDVASEATGLSAIADRYATALYELADQAKALDRVADDLRALRDAIGQHEDLRRLLRSPLLDRDDQEVALDAILEKAGAADLTRRFVIIVARNRRLFALSAMADAYLAILAERRGEVTAHVSTASKLTEDQVKSLTDALKKAVGAKVTVDTKVDEALIGGMVLRVGSRMFDNSLRTKLQRMQLAMKGIG